MSIEESIQQIETLIEAWQLDEADLNQTDINAMQVLLKEKQELKEQLDKYENPEDMTLMMMWCTEKVKDENKALKKQVEENKDNYNCLLKQKEEFEYIMSKQVDYQGQQKEFINYLEDYQDGASRSLDPYDCGINDCLGDVLSKYKEIIGGNKDEK